MKFPCYEIPLSEKDLSKEQLDSLAKLGFYEDEHIERVERNIYLSIPENSRLVGSYRKNNFGRYQYFLTYENKIVLEVFQSTDFHKLYLDLTLNSKTIDAISEEIPKPFEDDTKLTEYQDNIAKTIRDISRNAFQRQALLDQAKLAIGSLKDLRRLREEHPIKHDTFIKSNRMFMRAYAHFPKWTDTFNYISDLMKLDAGANYGQAVRSNSDPLEELSTQMNLFLGARNPKYLNELSQYAAKDNEMDRAKDKITQDDFKSIILNGLSEIILVKLCTDQSCLLLKRQTKKEYNCDIIKLFPESVQFKDTNLDLTPFSHFICGYFECTRKRFSIARDFLKTAQSSLKEWESNDDVPSRITNYLCKQIKTYGDFVDNKLGKENEVEIAQEKNEK